MSDNALEDYALAVFHQLSEGSEVTSLSGSFCYVVEKVDYREKIGDWPPIKRQYFPSLVSAENYIRVSLYEDILMAIGSYRKLVEENIDPKEGWGERDWVQLQNLLGGNGTGLDIWADVGFEIAETGRSDKVLRWFLGVSMDDLLAWHEKVFVKKRSLDEAGLFSRYRYGLIGSKQLLLTQDILKVNPLQRPSEIGKVLYSLLDADSIFNSIEYSSIEPVLVESMQIAVALGAEVYALPGTTCFAIELRYGGYGVRGKIPQGLYTMLGDRRVAEFVCLLNAFRELISTAGMFAPWNLSGKSMAIEDWCSAGLLWGQSNPISDLYGYIDAVPHDSNISFIVLRAIPVTISQDVQVVLEGDLRAIEERVVAKFA